MPKHEWTPLLDTLDVRKVLWLKPEDDVRNFQCCEKTNTVRADFYRPNGLPPQRRTFRMLARGGRLSIGDVPA